MKVRLLLMLAHLLTTLAKLLGPGGAKAIVADSLLMKQKLLIINRSRQRAPNLTAADRMPVATKNIVRIDFVDFFATTIVRSGDENYRPPRPVYAARSTPLFWRWKSRPGQPPIPI
jgi:hypothetical protein